MKQTFRQPSPLLLANLNEEEERVMVAGGTEPPNVGTYVDFEEEGTYYCKRCGTPLYRSSAKFHSGCGWPAFDDELPFSIERRPDADGLRTEIRCATCQAHLGHVFIGEGFTDKEIRHCVNSISLQFRPGPPEAIATYAGGCFWGMEYLFRQKEGVRSVMPGYTGGWKDHPTYEAVSEHTTGHREAIQVSYNPTIVSYKNLTTYFFEIHDPTQQDGQGPDIGEQYRSAIFYRNRHEFETAEALIAILEEKGLAIATELLPRSRFWPAEEHHRNYYRQRGTRPYCHAYVKRF